MEDDRRSWGWSGWTRANKRELELEWSGIKTACEWMSSDRDRVSRYYARSTFTYIISHPNYGPCLHLHASRFLQQPSSWDKCLPPWPSPIGPKFGCSFDPQNSQIWSDLGCTSAWPSLASGSVSHSIQAQLHHEQLPGRPCSGVPDWAVPLRDWHSSKAQPSVVVPGSAPGPSISEGTIREKRFLRLLTTAVELTSCRHLNSPQRASTFSKKTQNSLYATVHVMPLRIYVNSVISTTTTTYYGQPAAPSWGVRRNLPMDVVDPVALRYWVLQDDGGSILLNPGLVQGKDVNVLVCCDVVEQCGFVDGWADVEAGEVDGGRRRCRRMTDRSLFCSTLPDNNSSKSRKTPRLVTIRRGRKGCMPSGWAQ